MEPEIFIKERLIELEKATSKAKAKLKENAKNLKFYSAFVIASAVLIGFDLTHVINLATWLNVVLWIVGIFFLLAIIGTDLTKYKLEIDSNDSIKKIFLGLPEPTNDSDKYFDKLVKINIENLAAYYALVKSHTSQSFRISTIVGFVGFLILAAGLIIGFKYQEFKDISYIAAGSGLLIEFISGVLFYLYNKTIIQLKEYHDSLIDVQNVLLSFKLIENTKDEKIKAEMISKMLEYLVKK
jgi:hypothetical protein